MGAHDFLRCLRYLLFKDPAVGFLQEETEATEGGAAAIDETEKAFQPQITRMAQS